MNKTKDKKSAWLYEGPINKLAGLYGLFDLLHMESMKT